MFYFKFFLLCLWLIFCCVVGIIFLIPHWGTGRLNRDFGRAFSWGALKILGIRVHYEGVEFLETSQPCIYLINHQSALDLAIFGSLFPRNTVIIGKQELLWIPFFGIFYWAAGNFVIQRNKKSQAIRRLRAIAGVLKEKSLSLWIFPEGTRNNEGKQLLKFRRGAFFTAIQAQLPLVPIVAGSLKNVISWKQRSLTSGVVRIQILPPITTLGKTEKEVDALVNQVYMKMSGVFSELSR